MLDLLPMQAAFPRFIAIAAAASIASGTAFAARPEVAAETKLEHCGVQTCLLVAGRRRDPAAPVLVNGHSVEVRGERRWRLSLPLDTVRSWSAPGARSIDIGLDKPNSARVVAALPTGLFVKRTELAFLDVRAR